MCSLSHVPSHNRPTTVPMASYGEKAEILHDPNCRDADSPVDEAAKKAQVQQEVAIKSKRAFATVQVVGI